MRHSTKGAFQIYSPVSRLNISNNISLPQVRVSIKETEHDNFWNFLTINVLDKSFHNIEWSRPSVDLQCSDNSKINLSFVKLLPYCGMIWSLALPFRIASHKSFWPKKFVPHEKLFYEKIPPYSRGDTM